MSDDDPWSAVAGEWSELWAGSAAPAQRALVAAAGIGSGTRVLDVGCGGGEFVRMLAELGADAAGADPAAGMAARAAARTGADIRVAGWESLPWPDGSLDVVTAVNALQFADDPATALAEAARILVPGGAIAIANWAEAALSDLDAIEAAVARAHGEEPGEDPDYRIAGGLELLMTEAGLTVAEAGVVDVPWAAPDDDTLVRAVLLGEDAAGLADGAETVLRAARPFRRPSGGYELRNRFRWAVARTAAD